MDALNYTAEQMAKDRPYPPKNGEYESGDSIPIFETGMLLPDLT